MARLSRFGGILAASIFLLAGCGGDPLSSSSQSTDTIVVGSQDYYSNEIVAEIYAQALEGAGFNVDRQFRIGQREVYLPEMEKGTIDLMPEYTGNLLQYWDSSTAARTANDVYADLEKAVPDGLRVLDQSQAADQDSYTVTAEFASRWNLATIDDLAKVTVPMTLGANSEAEDRPYGPAGLKKTYGVSVSFTPIEDAGGPLTVKALTSGQIQLANIYSADPAIKAHNLVSLKDTKGLFLASNVVPLAGSAVDADAAKVINTVSANLTTDDLIALNARSVNKGESAATIAKDWLAAHPTE